MPGLNFRADLPFDGMRPVYAAFEKEIPMALQSTVGFFKTLKYYETGYYFLLYFGNNELGRSKLRGIKTKKRNAASCGELTLVRLLRIKRISPV